LTRRKAVTNDAAYAALEAVYHDPELFVREFLQADPEPWQCEFLRAVAGHARVAVKSAKGVGKTTALAWLILWFLLTRLPCKIGITAPSAPQLEAALWPELRSWHARLPDVFRDSIEITSDKAYRVEAPAESFAIARTASVERPEALQGL